MTKKLEWDATSENAVTILTDLKAKGGRFREVDIDWSFPASRRLEKGHRFVCPCGGDSAGNHRLLARVVVGHADEIDGVFTWLWVAGHATPKKKVPPSAVAIYDGQEAHQGRNMHPLLTTCPRCHVTYFFFPGFLTNIPGLLPIPSPQNGGPQNILTPGIVHVLISDGAGEYDRRVGAAEGSSLR